MSQPAEPTNPNPQPSADGQAPARQIHIDDSKAIALYCDFCRVTGTPEEMMVDFGLNPQPMGVPAEPIAITQRIVMNYYTAKRMLHALQLTLQSRQATFGVLETNIQRRVTAGHEVSAAAGSCAARVSQPRE